MDAESLIDRRRLRRRLGRWRVLAVLALALAVVAIGLAAGWRPGTALQQIARVEVSGLITEDEKFLELLDDLREEDGVKAVIVKVDSPGGTTVGGETLYHAVRRLAETKPVAAEVGTLAASAGYMVAIAADRVVAHNSSIVGSIGVIFQYVNASELLARIGVDVNAVKSAPLKAEPSPFAPAPPEAIEMIRRLVLNSYDWFVGLVAERRGFTPEAARQLADGSVFTGEQGLANRLVDALGGEEEIRRWLESERGVPKDLEIVEREPKQDGTWGLGARAQGAFFRMLGLDPQARDLPAALGLPTPRLDGLLSLWQPPAH
ncbi:signal peptide peptidase SppA [Aureimonas jatrophae]|uniref:Signal peptide peptidase A. Serine peptidase. MEROPS family S49 n=1 Tax=Aureimonas jatrophae TaxID=1166073 RepID=A0A1H0IM98_9HYPH|nr:signal peptide peptidase SppA [Aureimonas jatrophae]MBB3952253.1 protease-4 [Aureimonas jatrophae]SDO32522.1 signal peptide peptidase A. Serine peptidase. MEROPS family S49 [Aureimonas jatrophae]